MRGLVTLLCASGAARTLGKTRLEHCIDAHVYCSTCSMIKTCAPNSNQ